MLPHRAGRRLVIVSKNRWRDLDPRIRRALLITAATDGALTIAALVDLARRSPNQVRGSRARWAVALSTVNSAGILPLVYLTRGRRNP